MVTSTMINIGVSQIKNSTKIEENFVSIQKSLQLFEQTDVDLIVFPECSLSGFSAKIGECTLDLVTEHLNSIDNWSKNPNPRLTFLFLGVSTRT